MNKSPSVVKVLYPPVANRRDDVSPREGTLKVNVEVLQEKLGKGLVNSPFLSVMIVNRKYQVVWHNQRFAEEFNHGADRTGVPCFQAAGFDKIHADCPLQKSIKESEPNMGNIESEDSTFFYMCIPLDAEHAAKVYVFLPRKKS